MTYTASCRRSAHPSSNPQQVRPGVEAAVFVCGRSQMEGTGSAQKAGALSSCAMGTDPGQNTRFWENVDRSDGCWLWRGPRNAKGYGQTQGTYAHRIAWSIANGAEIPFGSVIRHRCDVPSCVRPDHLEIGSYADNTRDMYERGRGAWGARSGAARLTEESVKEVRALAASGLSYGEIAIRVGVTKSTIFKILAGKTWTRLPGINVKGATTSNCRPYRLSAEDAAQIRARRAAGETGRALAAAFGISDAMVSRIVLGRSWKEVR